MVQYAVSLQGQQLEWVDNITHLGHVLCNNCDDATDIRKRMSDFVCQVNYFLAKFGHLNVLFRSKLFTNFCLSLYGCQLWPLVHKCINDFAVVWRKSVRRIWRLPSSTHNALLPFFVSGNNFSKILQQRFIIFANDCLCSPNALVNFISYLAGASQLHTFGRNMSYIVNYVPMYVSYPKQQLHVNLCLCVMVLFL